jgi:hypothetical protein
LVFLADEFEGNDSKYVAVLRSKWSTIAGNLTQPAGGVTAPRSLAGLEHLEFLGYARKPIKRLAVEPWGHRATLHSHTLNFAVAPDGSLAINGRQPYASAVNMRPVCR